MTTRRRTAGASLLVAGIVLVGGAADRQAAAVAPVLERVEAGAIAGSTLPRDDDDAAALAKEHPELRDDLLVLAEAWSDAGGETGFPFWDKAYRRWQAGEVGDAEFREYVDAYLHQLEPGARQLGRLRVEGAAIEVRSELELALQERVEAMQLLRAHLDAKISRRAPGGAGDDEQRQHFENSLQQSYFHTRVAMNRSQELLEQAGAAPIPEGSFL